MYDETCKDCPNTTMTKMDIAAIWREIEESKEQRKALNERVGIIEGNAKKTDETIKWIKESMTDIKNSIEKIATTLEAIKLIPGTRWNKIVDISIAAIVGGAIGIVLTKIF